MNALSPTFLLAEYLILTKKCLLLFFFLKEDEEMTQEEAHDGLAFADAMSLALTEVPASGILLEINDLQHNVKASLETSLASIREFNQTAQTAFPQVAAMQVQHKAMLASMQQDLNYIDHKLQYCLRRIQDVATARGVAVNLPEREEDT